MLVQHAPVRRYHIWQTPEARIAPKAPQPVRPRWLAAFFKGVLGATLYARCKNLAMGARTKQ
jgi:hypothetical protein